MSARDELAALRAALEEMTRCRDNALRALYRDDVETDVDLEETIAAPFYGPGWDWDEADLMHVVREAVAAIRPAFAKLTEERNGLRVERHSTNEALDNAVRETATLRARVAELEQTVERRTRLLRDVQDIARKLTAEAKGRQEYGVRLRDRVAELEAAAAKVAKFCADRASYITSIRNCHPDNGHDYDRWQGHAAARRQLSQLLGLPVAWPAEDKATPVPQQRQVEDPHDSVLHHDYALGRDLPAIPHQQDRRAL